MKYISITLCFLLIFPLFTLTGCTGSEDGKLVVELLNEISRGNWTAVYDISHPALIYCGPDKEAFVNEMPHYGASLEEFFKGAEFKVISIKHEDEWSTEGIPLTDVSRVLVSMDAPTKRSSVGEYTITKEFTSVNQAEILVSPDPTDENLARKVLFHYGDVKPANYVRFVIADNEYSSPYPNKTVSDPEPGQNRQPSKLDFFDVFDADYQRKYVACVLTINNTKTVLAISHEGEVLYLEPLDPPLNPSEKQITGPVWDSFVSLMPEDIASFVPPVPKDYEFSYAAKEMKEKVGQALKLFIIAEDGYGKYKERFPAGIMSVTGETKIEWPSDMVDTKGKTLKRDDFKNGVVVFIHMSSCGSCMNKAVSFWEELLNAGLSKNQVIFISKSMQDKLGGFEKRIDGSSIVIDQAMKFVLPLNLNGSPSMSAIDENMRLVVSLDSYEMNDSFKLSRALSLITSRQ